LRKGKGGGAVIPHHAEHGHIDLLVIDHLGTRQSPDGSGDRVFPDGRDADEVDDSIVELHTGLGVLMPLNRLEDTVALPHVPHKDSSPPRRHTGQELTVLLVMSVLLMSSVYE
jgi:hypothetical protein